MNFIRKKWLVWVLLLFPLGLVLSRMGPELKGEHSWRQSLYADISRNYSNGSADFFHPSVSWAGEKPGAVGCEFPLIPYLAALFPVKGEPVVTGRIVSLISLIAVLFLTFKLTLWLADKETAFLSVLFLAYNPAFLYYSRCFMPDVPTLALSLATLLIFVRWSETGDWKAWGLLVTVSSLGGLLKLSHFLIFFPIGYLVFKQPELKRRKSLWLGLAVNFLIPLLWYLYALKISRNVYPYFFAGLDRPHWIFRGGFKDLGNLGYFRTVFSRLSSYGFFTPIGSLLLLSGFFCLPEGGKRGLLPAWVFGFLFFWLSTPQGQMVHEYYQLPLVIPGSVLAAMGLRKIRLALEGKKGKTLLFSLLAGLVVIPQLVHSLNPMNRYRFAPSAATVEAGRFIKENTDPQTRIIFYSPVAELRNFPLIFYTADRRGWLFDNLLYGRENWTKSDSNVKYQLEKREDFWDRIREENPRGSILVAVLKPYEYDRAYLYMRFLFEKMPLENSYYEIYRW